MLKQLSGPERVGIIGASALLLLSVLISFFPEHARVWGLDGFSYLTSQMKIVTLCFILLCTFICYIALKKSVDIHNDYSRFIIPALLSIFCLAILIFPSSTFLRGDGQLLINHLNIGKPASFRSPLYARIVGVLFNMFRPLNFSPKNIYVFIDLISFIVFFLALLRFSNRFTNPISKFFVIVTGLFSGSLPLLFGLVEHYAILHALIAWSLIYSMESIEADRFPYLGLFINILAIGFHVSAVVLLPAYIFPILKRQRRGIPWTAFWIAGIICFSLVVLFFRQHLVAPFSKEFAETYSLFSLNHLLDLINLDFWSVPVLIAITLPALLATGKQFEDHLVLDFLLAGIIGSVAFALLFSPDLGMARDADLLVLYCIPATFWSLRLWYNKRNLITPVLAASCFLAGISTVGMQIINQGIEKSSVERFIRQLKLDPEKSAYGYEVLAIYYRSKGNVADEELAYLKALDTEKNERYYLRLGQIALELGQPALAEKRVQNAIEIKPDLALAYGVLGKTFDDLEKIEQADSAFQKSLELEPEVGVHYANYAAFLLKHNLIESAGKVIDRGIKEAIPNAQLHFIEGLYFMKLKMSSSALRAFEKCRGIDPGGIWDQKATVAQRKLMIAPSNGY